jgi:hypothetical protein
MSLLLSSAGLDERRLIAAGPLRPLTESLAADLEQVKARPLHFPTEKALLSREGGRCAKDGSLLTFDPFQPYVHVCPRCGTEYHGELHDRFWIYWYQLWLAERAVHAATLHRLGLGDFEQLAGEILDGYGERYASYPNADNVLGPTRLFFSTYLESVWLLQICIAADLLAETNPALVERVRDRIIEPSRSIIRQYDEAGSNRQVWNDAALLAAARMLGDDDAAALAVFGPSGVTHQLSTGLLADGTWYEGENYHLFAHRGLWYGVTMAEEAGFDLPPSLVARFQLGFATPFSTALPDFTMPSRRDSQYAISLRQWRVAEHTELGLARQENPALIGALERIYRDDIPRGDTGRGTSSADVERNAPASSLTRADLSWRALLRALPQLPPLEPIAPQSVLLPEQGLAVFRRNEGRTYVALDYGHSGGGHGHPDRLNLLLADGTTRWLDDYGTGSYVDPSLHWYRSTLAHNAPLLGGKSQPPRSGDLVAYDERQGAGWIKALVALESDAYLHRTIVVTEHYLVDDLFWIVDPKDDVDLPIHADLAIDAGIEPLVPGKLTGSSGLEDGFRFLSDTSRQEVPASVVVEGRAAGESETLRVWSRSEQATEWWRAVAPGPPGSADRAFRVIRTKGGRGGPASVIAWSNAVADVQFGDEIRVSLTDGTRHTHRRGDFDWQIEQHAGDTVVLGGHLDPAGGGVRVVAEEVVSRSPLQLHRVRTMVVELGEANYRRSEQTWLEAGSPNAQVTLEAHGSMLRITVSVRESELNFAARTATNRYDNEQPDINGDGIQLYVRTAAGLSGWVLVPVPNSQDVRARPIDAWSVPLSMHAAWAPSGKGYEVVIELGTIPLALDVIVNEMPHGRERRRGQLLMSGALTEFVYLRGDRHDASRLIPIQLTDD